MTDAERLDKAILDKAEAERDSSRLASEIAELQRQHTAAQRRQVDARIMVDRLTRKGVKVSVPAVG